MGIRVIYGMNDGYGVYYSRISKFHIAKTWTELTVIHPRRVVI